MRRFTTRLLLVVFALTGGGLAHAQEEGISQRKQEKILARKAKEQKKEQARQEKEGRKRHLSIQDKAAQKRIKRNMRRADRHGSGRHRDAWPARWFRRKR